MIAISARSETILAPEDSSTFDSILPIVRSFRLWRDVPAWPASPSPSDVPAFPSRWQTPHVEAASIVVAIGDHSLARVLTLWLSSALQHRCVRTGGLHTVADLDTILVTPADCEPAEVAEIVARGTRVVVLAPVGRSEEASRYQRAGASYIEMTVDNTTLLSALELPADQYAIEVRADSSQRESPKRSA